MHTPETILAINDGHDANVTLARGDDILLSASRERFSRKKFQGGFPVEIMRYMRSEMGVSPQAIDRIIFTNRLNFVHRFFPSHFQYYQHDYFSKAQVAYLLYQDLFRRIPGVRGLCNWAGRIKYRGYFKRKPLFIDHHLAHALSAYYFSGIHHALIVTADNLGDGLAATVYLGKEQRVQRLKGIGCLHSPGQFYGEMTQLIGFDPLKHAGKTTGLAARGDWRKYYALMEQLFAARGNGNLHMAPVYRPFRGARLKRQLKGARIEDIAAAAQKRLEDVMLAFVRHFLAATGARALVLAGGVFANVRLNQVLAEQTDIDAIYIHPGMTDAGLSMGAYAWYRVCRQGRLPAFLPHVYLGPAPGPLAEHPAAQRYRITQPQNLPLAIAQCLQQGKVVAVCRGAMEYGPRALGNRSILFRPDDPSVNDWLNHKLKRTEFMPFAPTLLAEDADELLFANKATALSDRFMTITFRTRPLLQQKAPAIIHLDGTVRPQVLRRQDNPFYYQVIETFKRLTGIPCVLNTSFNMHEEPIVMTADDALRAFEQAQLDVLVVNDCLVSRK